MPDRISNQENPFSRFCASALYLIACVVCVGLLLLNMIYRVELSHEEVPTYLGSLPLSACIMALTALDVPTVGMQPEKQ